MVFDKCKLQPTGEETRKWKEVLDVFVNIFHEISLDVKKNIYFRLDSLDHIVQPFLFREPNIRYSMRLC